MSNSTIKLKSSTTAGNTPTSLETGEFAINVADGNLFYGSASAVKQDLVLETLTVKGSLTAENYVISSSVTHMTQSFSSGSTVFGDSIDDTHLFTGSLSITGSSHVIKGTSTKINQGLKTAIDISSTSGNNVVKLGDALVGDNETYIEINDNTQVITFSGQSIRLGNQVTPSITASGIISSSNTIIANAFSGSFSGDGSGLTGLPAAAISSYNNSGANRLITSVNSSTVEGEQYLTYTNEGGLVISNGSVGSDISLTIDGDIVGSDGHIKLALDAGGNDAYYISSSGDTLATTFKLHLGDVSNQGNGTNLIVDDENEQITTSKALSVTGNITVTGTVDGRDVATDGTKLDGIETSADVTDTANVTAAGALMDSELSEIATVKALTAAGISGSFNAASASFSTRVTANDAKLTANTSNVTSAGALMDSEVTSLSLIKGLTAAQISGAFDSVSASLASDIPTNNNQLTNGAGYLTTVDISTDTNLVGGTNLTLSGDTMNMDASINLTSISIGGYATLGTTGTLLDIGGDASWDNIRYGKNGSPNHNFNGNITASGDISSSGFITADRFYGTISATDIEGTVDISSQTNLAVGNGITLTGDTLTVTAGTGLTQNAGGLAFDADGGTLTTNNTDVDHILVNDGGTFKRITKGNINVGDFNNDVGYLTSSPFTAAGISGSFTSPSGGFSTRVTTLETNNTGTNTGDQDLSPYALIANVSGAFTSTSASIAVDVSTLKSDFDTLNDISKGRITYLYTSSVSTAESVAQNYIHYVDSTVDYILINTSSYNNVDLDGSSTSAYANFFYTDVGSLLTVRNVNNGAFRTFKVTDVVTNYQSNGDTVRFQVDSLLLDQSSGSLSVGDEVEFIWDKSAGVGGAYGTTVGSGLAKTLAGIYQGGYNYLDMFFGIATDTEFDGTPENLSGVETSASFGLSRYFLPAISQSESLTLGGLTVNGTITGTINTSSITDFPTEVSRSAAAAGFGAGGGGGSGTVTEVTVGTGLDVTNGTTTPNVTLDLTEVIASDAANRVLTSDGDGTLTAESELTYDGTTLNVDGYIDVDSSATSQAVVDITNTNTSSPMSSDNYALKVAGGVAIGTPGGQTKAYGGYFTAGDTNLTNPDSVALYAQSHHDGAPNSYAALFSGSAGGVVGINTLEPSVELDVVGDISASNDVRIVNNLSLGLVTDVEDRISSYRTVIESSCYFGQNTLRYLPFNSLSEQTGFNYLSITPAAANGRLISITMWPQSSGGSTVVGLHINSNATAATTDTQTISAGTPLTFTFSSNNTFSQNDELSFSVNPTNNINGMACQIVLEYDY